jgi:hypothetical protein
VTGYGVIRIVCRCCKLPKNVRDYDGLKRTMCDECHQHQGQQLDKRLARAESHEAMLHQRLLACRMSESRAQEAIEIERNRAAAALASRNSLADRLVSAAERSGRHNCPAVQLGRDPQVAEFARKYRERRGSLRER